VFTADIITSLDRNGELSFEETRPEAPLPEDVKRAKGFAAPGWFDHIDQRWTVGRPFKVSEKPYSITWARDAEERPLDAKSLITLSDAIAPRTFFVSEKPTFGSTISFSVTLYASKADFAEVGTDFVMIEGDSDVIRAGTYDQRGKLWSRSGKLLAISNQIAFYK
jgi:acyl-CoA thioesterase